MQVNEGEKKVTLAQFNQTLFLPHGLASRTRLEPKDRVHMKYTEGGDLECEHKGHVFIVPHSCLGPLSVESDVQTAKPSK